jgi:hypothetical protein
VSSFRIPPIARHVLISLAASAAAIAGLIVMVNYRSKKSVEETAIASIEQNIQTVEASLRAFMESDPRSSAGFPRYMERLRGSTDVLQAEASSARARFEKFSTKAVARPDGRSGFHTPELTGAKQEYTLRVVPADATRRSTLKNALERIKSELQDQPKWAGAAPAQVSEAAKREYDRLYPAPDEIEDQVLGSGYTYAAQEERENEPIYRTTVPIAAATSCLECHSTAVDGQPLGVITVQHSLQHAEARKQALTSAMAQFGGGVILVLMLLGILNIRSLTRTLRTVAGDVLQTSEHFAIASDQVRTASIEFARGTSDQASSVEETSASMEQMAATTRQSADNANQVSRLASEAQSKVDEGGVVVKDMIKAISAIKDASADIKRIIKVIDEIAFQTNLLALNAAVEAARSGEAGRGFAVVADEVRNLAKRSAEAARETAGKIETAIARTDEGVITASRAASAFDEINGSVKQVNALMHEIARAATEQSQGIQQVTGAMAQIDKVVQVHASHAEQSASAAEEMARQSEALKNAVSALINLVGHATASATKVPAAPPEKQRAVVPANLL